MRGVAALAVVTFHFMEMAIYDYSKLFIGHGFLAVDFFFCLSGFVIGYAYDDRVGTMGVWEFFKARLIRLHPLVVLGSVLGLIALFIDPFAASPVVYRAGRVALLLLASIFLIPYPVMHERGFNLFSLNAPSWSLFWEYVANIFYAVAVCRLSRRWLLFSTGCAAVVLCAVGYRAGALSGGWDGRTFWQGGARVAYSFLAGLLVYRFKWIIRSRIGFGTLSVLLLITFVMPYAQGGWLREAVVILFYFPLLVAIGAGATLTPRSEKLCTFAGDYVLSAVHDALCRDLDLWKLLPDLSSEYGTPGARCAERSSPDGGFCLPDDGAVRHTGTQVFDFKEAGACAMTGHPLRMRFLARSCAAESAANLFPITREQFIRIANLLRALSKRNGKSIALRTRCLL